MALPTLSPGETIVTRVETRVFVPAASGSRTRFFPRIGWAYLTTQRIVNHTYSLGWLAFGGGLGWRYAEQSLTPSSVIELPLPALQSLAHGRRGRGGRPLVLTTVDNHSFPLIIIGEKSFLTALQRVLATHYQWQLVETAPGTWAVLR